jgi:hypothetical protein
VSEGRVPDAVRELTEQVAVELQKVFDEARQLAGESTQR